MTKYDSSVRIRFDERINIVGECWCWIGSKCKDGYGQFHVKIDGKWKSIRPHRYSYEIFKGEIGDKKVVCHHCDNPSCVNPEHLFLGTQKDNIQDALKKKRMVGPRGMQQWQAKFIDEDIKKIRLLNKEGMNGNQISKLYKVDRRVIYDILKNVTWRHVI